jgi:hypothetical protein
MCYDVVRINYYFYTKTVDDNIFPAIRDIWCRDYKYDFGYEVLRYHTFWMDETSDPTKLKTNVNIEQCMEYCQNISCLSYTFTGTTTACYLHYGHKYTPHYRKWWVDGVEQSTLSYQRLCFKGTLFKERHWHCNVLVFRYILGRHFICF